MSAKKPGYLLEQHKRVGIALQQMRDRLLTIADELGKAYPKEVSLLAARSSEQIDKLRNKLDNIVCAENPDFKSASEVYYRGRK